MAIEQKSKSQLVSALSRARGTLASAKEKTKGATRRGGNALLTAGAGYGVGMAKKKLGDASGKILIPGTEIEGD